MYAASLGNIFVVCDLITQFSFIHKVLDFSTRDPHIEAVGCHIVR